MKSIYKKIKIYIPLPARIIFVIALFSAAIHLIAVVSPAFADFFNIYISSFFRSVLSHISGIIPFSIAELVFISLPVTASALFIYSFFVSRRSAVRSYRFMFSLLATLSLLYSTFVLNFATSYHGSTLDEKLEIERRDVSADELYKTALLLIDEVNALKDDIDYSFASSSQMPYKFDEMNRRLIDAYDTISEKYYFIQKLNSKFKPIILSEALTYTHISGLYSFFTGEANLNMNFPDYTLPFTAAHELAHQRGVAREDEANFMAFLVCVNSNDTYIRYSGYLNMYEYVSSALYRADKQLYSTASSRLSNRARYEMIAFNNFFDKYKDSTASNVSGVVNDAFLKLQGTAGTKSYGMVVDLAVAYYLS